MINMNFEIIDNWFQACVMLISATASYISALKYARRAPERSRLFLTLAFGYTSFMLGTLFFVLHIVILSYNAKIFYVSEISWTAAYMFFLSFAMMREKGREKESRTPLAWIPVVIAVFPTAMIVAMYGASVVGGIFTCALTAIAFMAVRGIHRAYVTGSGKRVDVTLLAVTALQALVYIVSSFTYEYTRFNLYFAVDITLSFTLMSLVHAVYRELETCARKASAEPGADKARDAETLTAAPEDGEGRYDIAEPEPVPAGREGSERQ